MEYRITKLDAAHVREVVDVHLQAFPGFFLTFLGPSFLKLFYQSFTEDAMGVGFVAVGNDDDKVVGVVVGPLVPDGYFKRLLVRRWWSFCVASIGAVLRRPAVVKRLWSAVFYRGDAPAGPQRALLSSLAVLPDVQKKGIGRMLVNAWTDAVRQHGSTGCFLTTDADQNDSVNRFYQGMGWIIEAAYYTPQKRKMNRYVYDFSEREL